MKKLFKLMVPVLVLIGGFVWFYRDLLLEQITEFYGIDWRPVVCIALASAIAGLFLGYALGHYFGFSADKHLYIKNL